MAKVPRGIGNVKEDAGKGITAKTKRLIEGIEKRFSTYVKNFIGVRKSGEELAPEFMKAFNQWASEVGRGATFVKFVQMLDDSVPIRSRTQGDEQGYRDHRTYQAADYLRKINAGTRSRSTAGAGDAEGTQAGKRAATVSNPVLRVLAALQNLLPMGQRHTLWEATMQEFGWNQQQVQKAQAQINDQKVTPLVIANATRNLDRLRLTIPAHAEEGEEEATGTDN